MKQLWLALLAVGCVHTAPFAPPFDPEAARQSLLQADLDFAQEVALHGTEAWVAVFAADGIMLSDGGGTIRGPDAIRKAMSGLGDPQKAKPAVQLRWRPLGAEISRDGTLGWTYGNALLVSAKDKEKVKYVTIWRREGSAWKAVADIGNGGEAEPGKDP
jgi:hypothetical protein